MAEKKKIVVVGGGFGGIKTALELSKDNRFTVTLISDRTDFWYFPSLYHTATGITNQLSVIPLKRLFEGKAVQVITARINKLDRETKTLSDDKGVTYEYDALVLALGVVTNYFGIPGLEEFAYGIKTLEEVENFKTHLHEQLTETDQPDLNYIIVGGGATGIELAGQLPGYLKEVMKRHGLKARKIHIDLVEGAPHLMPRMPRAVGRAIEKQLRKLGVKLYLGKRVEGLTADALTISGKPIRSHTVVWTAGQANNPFFTDNGFTITPHRKVEVDEFLRASKDVFVIGDNADTPFSGMAQTALYDAEFIAHNFVKEADSEPKLAYRPKKPIYVTPAGPHWAAVEWGKVHIYGWLGWFLREAGDIKGFLDIENPLEATEQWLKEFKRDDNCPICGDIV
jgi:NADH dehydrogenase